MMGTRAKTNTIAIHDRNYVLAWVGGGAAHLVAQAGADVPARPIMNHVRMTTRVGPTVMA